MWDAAAPLAISTVDRRLLETWLRGHNTPRSLLTRCHIVLRAVEGIPNRRIAQGLHVSRPTVILWRERLAELGVGLAAEEIAPSTY